MPCPLTQWANPSTLSVTFCRRITKLFPIFSHSLVAGPVNRIWVMGEGGLGAEWERVTGEKVASNWKGGMWQQRMEAPPHSATATPTHISFIIALEYDSFIFFVAFLLSSPKSNLFKVKRCLIWYVGFVYTSLFTFSNVFIFSPPFSSLLFNFQRKI